jgi:hypothetical protein
MQTTAVRVTAKVAAALVGLLILAGCDPTPTEPLAAAPAAPPARFGLDACNNNLPGSQQLADIDASGVPIVCEAHLPGAPSWASGWFDGTTIHIWPQPDAAPDTYVLKVAAHEYGHSVVDRNPDWSTQWQALRGTTSHEDFPEAWAWCNYPHPRGIGYVLPVGIPTADQCGVMHDWYSAR